MSAEVDSARWHRAAETHLETAVELLESGDGDLAGVCLACGDTVESGVEPDAEEYPCESCGERAVFGASQVVILGAA